MSTKQKRKEIKTLYYSEIHRKKNLSYVEGDGQWLEGRKERREENVLWIQNCCVFSNPNLIVYPKSLYSEPTC
jgi:hypothetical protein